MLEGAAAIHYTTLAEQKLAEDSLGLSRGVVIPLGIEAELLIESGGQATPAVESPYVLVLSRLHQKKGLEVLLPAFLSLVKRPEFKSWKLVLAGDGDQSYVDSLKSLAHASGGNGNVVFAGWLDGEQRSGMLRAASLLALTSYQENFGLCAVEALACGVPVMVSPHVNLAPEIETAHAGWVTRLEPQAIEETLADALGHKAERAERGSAGRRFVVSRFSWEAVALQLEELYEQITR
jgi:glycosyltransferase involved in cell wall biosynthesis